MFSACNLSYYFYDLSKPNVLVLGASFEFEPFLELLLKEQVNVLCMDRSPALSVEFINRWDGQLVCLAQDFSDLQKTFDIVRDYAISHIAALPVGRALIIMGKLSDQLGFNSPSFAIIDTMTDKKAFHHFLSEQGLEDYQWSFLDSKACRELRAHFDDLEQKFGYPFIIKPVEGSGSMGAALISDRSDLEEYRLPERFISGGALAETALEGEEFCCAGFIDGESHFHIMTLLGKEVSKPPYRQESAYFSVPREREAAIITQYAELIARRIGLRSSFLTVDAYVTPDDRCFFIDIAPRLTGNNVLLAALYNGNNPLHIFRKVMIDGQNFCCRSNPQPAVIRFFDFEDSHPVVFSGSPVNGSWGSPLPAMDESFNVLTIEAPEKGLEMFTPEERKHIIAFENNLEAGKSYGALHNGGDLARGYIMARGATIEQADALTRRYIEAIRKSSRDQSQHQSVMAG